MFRLDETGLFWKRMPRGTLVPVEKVAPGFKASKDCFLLLLGGNGSGDYKIEPFFVCHSENPEHSKSYSKEGLPVVWRSNKKAWIAAVLFESLFASELHLKLKACF
jgi:hypothetical protein